MDYLIILLTGLVAGFFNVNAGGGSMLSLPVLIFFGLPPTVANGTNRVAIFFQNLTAISYLKKKKKLNFRESLVFAVPIIIGAILGSFLAVEISDELFKSLLSGVIIFILIFNLLKKKGGGKNKSVDIKSFSLSKKVIVYSSLFIIGLYGGIFQLGVGFLFLALTQGFLNLNIKKANILKITSIFLFNILSICIFFWGGKIDLKIGLVLAVGNSVGAFVGSRFLIKKNDKVIRFVLNITLVLFALKLLFG